jgi:hypothetical protein
MKHKEWLSSFVDMARVSQWEMECYRLPRQIGVISEFVPSKWPTWGISRD